MLWSSLLVVGLAQLALCKPLQRRWDDLVERHAWAEVPRGWELKAPAPADHTFDMRIGLTQHGIDDLIENLLEISDPAHSRYVSNF